MIERWLTAIRDHPDRPPAVQRMVLYSLALRMNWGTGRGFASEKQLAADAGATGRTVRRATKWGREAGYLLRTRRGHRARSDLIIASEWRLTQPDTGDLLEKPIGQNGQANRTEPATQPDSRTPPSRTISSGTVSSARGFGAEAPRARQEDPWAASVTVTELHRRGILPCPSCHRAPRTGHTPGCPQDGQQ